MLICLDLKTYFLLKCMSCLIVLFAANLYKTFSYNTVIIMAKLMTVHQNLIITKHLKI